MSDSLPPMTDEVLAAIEAEWADYRVSQIERTSFGAEMVPVAVDLLDHKLAQVFAEMKRLRAEVAGYRAAICFETTCTNCAAMLDHLASTEATCDQLQSSLTETASARDFLARSLEKQVDITERTTQRLENARAERDRLRAENTAQAAKITEHQLLASAVRRLLGSPTRSSVLELLDVIAGARSEVATPGVLGEIAAERARQDSKWGPQNHPDGTGGPHYRLQAESYRQRCDRAHRAGEVTWLDILLEEAYEASAEKSAAALRAELVQVAAVAVAWVEALDRRALGLDQNEEGQADANEA